MAYRRLRPSSSVHASPQEWWQHGGMCAMVARAKLGKRGRATLTPVQRRTHRLLHQVLYKAHGAGAGW